MENNTNWCVQGQLAILYTGRWWQGPYLTPSLPDWVIFSESKAFSVPISELVKGS